MNASLQMENTDGDVIPGVSGRRGCWRRDGDDSPSGANNGWALTAGKLAAEAIAE